MIISNIVKTVSATFLLLCFLCLKESTCEIISLQKLFLFSWKSDFRILDIQIPRYQMLKQKTF